MGMWETKIHWQENNINWHEPFSYKIPNEEFHQYKCPICNNSFHDKENLFEHIKNEHGELKEFLLLNEEVINNNPIFCNNIYSLELVKNNHSINHINIYIDGRSKQINIVDEKNIKVNLLNYFEVNNKYKIELHINNSKITIYQKGYPEITNKVVLNCVEQLQRGVYQNDKVEWDKLSSYINFNKFDDAERRYMNGFFEYFYAYTLSGNNRTQHYEQAFSLLQPFIHKMPLAKITLEFICFKFNWILTLKNLCTNGVHTDFYYISDFLSSQKSESTFQKSSPNLISEFKTKEILLIEDDEESNIKAILDFINNNMDDVKNYLYRFNDSDITSKDHDINLKDRIYLLKARYARKTGTVSKKDIIYYYSNILSPYYKKEAEVYING